MSAKKATKLPNVGAYTYEGSFSLDFSCVGVEVCRFALCEIMPPNADSNCCYNDHSTCISPVAKPAALEILLSKIKKELKQYEEACQ